MASAEATSVSRHFHSRRAAILLAVFLTTTILCCPTNASFFLRGSKSKSKITFADGIVRRSLQKYMSFTESCQNSQASIINQYFAPIFAQRALELDEIDLLCLEKMKNESLWFRSPSWSPFGKPLVEPLSVSGAAEKLDAILKTNATKKDPEISKIAAVYVYFEGLESGAESRMKNAEKIFGSSVHEELQAWIKSTSERDIHNEEAKRATLQDLNHIVKKLENQWENLSENRGVEIALENCITQLLPSPSVEPSTIELASQEVKAVESNT